MSSFQVGHVGPLVPATNTQQLAVKLFGTRYGTLHCCRCATDTDHTTAWHDEQHLGDRQC